MKKDEYDVIIIGAGIGGLVCGCYLAKAGMKVLMIEKRKKIGGCCKSFFIKGIKFQTGPHSLSSLRNDGILNVILDELGFSGSIYVKRSYLTDRFFTPDFILNLYSNKNRILEEINTKFPKEKKVRDFISNIVNQSLFLIISNYKKYTFKDVLDYYISNDKLKSIFSLFLLGNSGLPSMKINAAKALIILKEHFLDGGYYIKGGIDTFPMNLEKKFNSCKGYTLFNSSINSIVLLDNNSYRVGINNMHDVNNVLYVKSKYVVCSSDMTHFVRQVLNLDKNNIYKSKNMKQSLSCFTLYMCADNKKDNSLVNEPLTMWDMPHYDIELMHKKILCGDIETSTNYFMICNLTKTEGDNINKVKIACNAPFKNNRYWENEKEKKAIEIIKKIKRRHKLFENYKLQDITTPYDIFSYTSNYNGAIYGWAPYTDQSYLSKASRDDILRNMFFSSHWNTYGSGVPNVASSGRSIALRILDLYRFNKKTLIKGKRHEN